MSSFAKKMLEKYGWKEGEGLGKSREGVKTHIKVIRRDPHTASGLGHLSDPSVIHGQLNGKSNRDGGKVYSSEVVELDSVYSSLAASRKRRRRYDTSSIDDSESDDDKAKNTFEGKKSNTTKLTISSSSSSSSSSEDNDTTSNHKIKNSKHNNSTSKTNDDGSENMSTTPVLSPTSLLSDEELFRKCGGVRLGRAGRHRFFEGKLKRIHNNNNNNSNSNSLEDNKEEVKQ